MRRGSTCPTTTNNVTTPRSASTTHSSPSTTASSPPFGRLFLAALRSVGIEYVALDLLRKAKKNTLETQEYVVLWRLLHDLVLIVLLDFDIDADAIRHAAAEAISHDQLVVLQELVRHYLYEWGFVCRGFYHHADKPVAASVLLLAVAWLLAYARFFERQHKRILEIYLQSPTTTIAPRLPPYPNDVAIPASAVVSAVASVTTSSQQLKERIRDDLDVPGRLNQLQALLGRIHIHLRTLQSSMEEYDRKLERLRTLQRETGAVREDEFIPAYAIQVFGHGKSELERHVRVLTERLQMIEDEKLFYKWINGLVLQYTPESSLVEDDAIVALESQYAPLYADILHAKTALAQTVELYQQMANHYAVATKQWQQKAKTRTQQAKMEEKMEKLRHDIATKELFDVDTLFLDRSKQTNEARHQDTINSPALVDLERLQSQLQRVIEEITTEYCQVELI